MTESVTNQPSFVERHNRLLMVAASTVAITAGFAAIYFSTYGGTLALTIGLPLSLATIGTMGCTIALIIRATKRPTPEEDSDEFKPCIASSNTSTAQKPLPPELGGDAYLTLEAVKSKKHAVETFTSDILPPLFAKGNDLYKTLLKLYDHVYKTDSKERNTNIDAAMHEWRDIICDKLKTDDDYLIWVALDSTYIIDTTIDHESAAKKHDARCRGFRNGTYHLETTKHLLKLQATKIVGKENSSLHTHIDTWFEWLTLTAPFACKEQSARQPLVDAFGHLSADAQKELAWFFCKLAHYRYSTDITRRWKGDVDNSVMGSTEISSKINSVSSLFLSGFITVFSGLIYGKMEARGKGTPNACLFESLKKMTEPLLIPLAYCLHKKTPLFQKIKSIVEGDTVKGNTIDRTNLYTLADTLKSAVQHIIDG